MCGNRYPSIFARHRDPALKCRSTRRKSLRDWDNIFQPCRGGTCPRPPTHISALQCRRHFLRVDRHFNAGSRCRAGSAGNCASKQIVSIKAAPSKPQCREATATFNLPHWSFKYHEHFSPASPHPHTALTCRRRRPGRCRWSDLFCRRKGPKRVKYHPVPLPRPRKSSGA